MNTIYLDMDGVVADWNAYVDPILGRRQMGFDPYPKKDWDISYFHFASS